ncbi:hypothetical protein C7974DRAFT_377122 [Boeremia exigua]|uniref:uncharacterized protein n=1 Tax=Boeremia exigua TaxID=749465 RepID=UPI001E8DFDBA|nr:uncharacterized protein C7974DRAFT_377122 [Boeremia exigua]KAH6625633.1 hypothetical protein C7974DRAFT_377122 [Boeremia exigua]
MYKAYRLPDSRFRSKTLKAKAYLDGRVANVPQYLDGNTAQHLLARHETLSLATQALHNYQGQVREHARDLYAYLRNDPWNNSHNLFTHNMSIDHTTLFYLEQRRLLSAVAYKQAQGVARHIALHALREDMSTVSVLKYMLPFRHQVHFLSWMHGTLENCPYPKLQRLSSSFDILATETQTIVTGLQRTRVLATLGDDQERCHEIAKNRFTRSYTDLLVSCESLTDAMDHYLENHTTPSKGYRSSYLPRVLKNALSVMPDFIHCIHDAKDASTVIGMRRRGSTSHPQQNIFDILHHHIYLVLVNTRRTVAEVQRRYRALFKKNSRSSAIYGLENVLVQRMHDVGYINKALADIAHRDFTPLWIAHIETMSSEELERQNRVAQRHWVKQWTSIMARTSVVVKGLDDAARAIRGAHCLHVEAPRYEDGNSTHIQWSDFGRQHQYRAIKEMQLLEERFPSQSPKSEQALQELVGVDMSVKPFQRRSAKGESLNEQRKQEQGRRRLHSRSARDKNSSKKDQDGGRLSRPLSPMDKNSSKKDQDGGRLSRPLSPMDKNSSKKDQDGGRLSGPLSPMDKIPRKKDQEKGRLPKPQSLKGISLSDTRKRDHDKGLRGLNIYPLGPF